MDQADSQRVTLPDGRALSFAEYGDRGGTPIIYCHGFPGSRSEAKLTGETAGRLGLRIICPDRPGFGRSDCQPGRTLADWPRDLAALADALGLPRFSVLGVSGGGPYALACAQILPERLTGVGVVCGLGELHGQGRTRGMGLPARQFLSVARRAPRLARVLYEKLVGPFLGRHPALVMMLLTAGAPAADRRVLHRPEVRDIFIASTREAFARGPQGPTQELLLYTRPWNIQMSNIRIPVHLWHGEGDAVVPVRMGKEMALELPRCELHLFPDEGHFSLLINQMETILSALR